MFFLRAESFSHSSHKCNTNKSESIFTFEFIECIRVYRQTRWYRESFMEICNLFTCVSWPSLCLSQFGALTPLEPRLGKKLIEPLTNLIHRWDEIRHFQMSHAQLHRLVVIDRRSIIASLCVSCPALLPHSTSAMSLLYECVNTVIAGECCYCLWYAAVWFSSLCVLM